MRERALGQDGSVTTLVALHPESGELLGFVTIKEHSYLDGDCQLTEDFSMPEALPELYYIFTKVRKEGGTGKGVGSSLMMRVSGKRGGRSRVLGCCVMRRTGEG